MMRSRSLANSGDGDGGDGAGAGGAGGGGGATAGGAGGDGAGAGDVGGAAVGLDPRRGAGTSGALARDDARIFSTGRCSTSIVPPPHSSTARSITLRSSRMLPGQP